MGFQRAKQKLTLILIRDPHQPVRRWRMTRQLAYGLILLTILCLFAIGFWQYSLHRNSSATIDSLSLQLVKIEKHYDTLLNEKQSVIDDLRTEMVHMNNETEQIRKQLDQLKQLEQEIGDLLSEVYPDRPGETAPDYFAGARTVSAVHYNGIGGEEHAVTDKQWEDEWRQTQQTVANIRHEINQLSDKLKETKELLLKKIEQIRAYPDHWPTRSLTITSGYGVRIDPFTGRSAFHYGIDIAGKIGDPVIAAADGVVIETGRDSQKGNYVAIEHLEGIRTVYMHLSRIIAEKNQQVEKGETIAYLGSTGRSTGPHLHFEIIDNRRHVNPMHYLNTGHSHNRR